MAGDRLLNEVEVQSAQKMGDAIETNKVVLSDWRGRVCLTFEKRVDCLTLTAQEALTMSEALARQSYRAKFGDYPHGGKKQTSEQLRIRARNRVKMMLISKMKTPPRTDREQEVFATALVDEIMKLVT